MAGSRLSKFVLGSITAVAGIALAAWWLAPGLRSTPLDQARAAYDRGDFREARALAVAILTRSPDDPGGLRIMARASARLGNDETAQTLYSRIGEGKMEAEDFFVLGSTLERRGQLAAAVAVLERGSIARDDHAGTLEALARLRAREGSLDAAIDAAGRLATCPDWEARGSLILGVLDVENADPPGAASAIERALRSDPNLIEGHRLAGRGPQAPRRGVAPDLQPRPGPRGTRAGSGLGGRPGGILALRSGLPPA